MKDWKKARSPMDAPRGPGFPLADGDHASGSGSFRGSELPARTGASGPSNTTRPSLQNTAYCPNRRLRSSASATARRSDLSPSVAKSSSSVMAPHCLQRLQPRRFRYLPARAVLLEYYYGVSISIAVAHRAIHEKCVFAEKVVQAAKVASFKIGARDVVPAMTYPLGHAALRHFNAWQRQIDQFHSPAFRSQSPYQPPVSEPRQRGLKAEIASGQKVL